MLARSGAPALNPGPFTAPSKVAAGGIHVGGALLGRLSHGSSYLESYTSHAWLLWDSSRTQHLPVCTGGNFGRS